MPSQTDPTRFDVGILCVHGVGEPLRGQTLVEVGDTLYSWLDGWLKCASNPMPGAASISYAQVHRVEFAREPSFAAVHIRAGEIEQNWLIAESWWARDFIRPSFGQLVYWAFSVVPFTLTSHFASKLTRARGVYQSVAAFGEFVLSIPGALALYAVTIIVALIGLVPIEAFRSFAASIQRAVSATIGDSYIFVESPIQHAAMMSQVGKDLTWLAERCDAIVLVAHSQGAAVAYDELSSGSAPLPGLLITLGSGINKLSALRKSEAGGRERAFSRVLGKFSYIALAGSLFAEPGALWKKLLKDYGVIVVWISMILQEARNLSGEPASEAAKQLELPWLDFYARADPVPNGPLFATDTTRAQRSIEVRNRDSFFFDHTSYWNNRDEFVSQVFAAIAGVTSAPIPVPNTSAIVTASARRSLRVRTLALYRMVALALFALAVIAHWPELPTVWSSTEASLNRATMRLGFATPIHKVPSGTEGLAGLTVVAVLFVLCYLPSSLLWSWWDRQEMERLFQPRKYQAATSLLIFSGTAFLFIDFWACVILSRSSPASILSGLNSLDSWGFLICFVLGMFLGLAVKLAVVVATFRRAELPDDPNHVSPVGLRYFLSRIARVNRHAPSVFRIVGEASMASIVSVTSVATYIGRRSPSELLVRALAQQGLKPDSGADLWSFVLTVPIFILVHLVASRLTKWWREYAPEV